MQWLTLSAIASAALIFSLRVADMSLDTLRVLSVMRGRRAAAWVFGFFQSTLFVIAFTHVLQNLGNPLNIVGYAAGFATGNVVGITLEGRLAFGFVNIRIISPRRGVKLAEALREAGFAVTEVAGRGRDGTVDVLYCSARRRDVPKIEAVIQSLDEQAFLVTEDVRTARRGFWRS